MLPPPRSVTCNPDASKRTILTIMSAPRRACDPTSCGRWCPGSPAVVALSTDGCLPIATATDQVLPGWARLPGESRSVGQYRMAEGAPSRVRQCRPPSATLEDLVLFGGNNEARGDESGRAAGNADTG